MIRLLDVAPRRYKQLMNIMCKNTGIYIAVLSFKIRIAIFQRLILISHVLNLNGLNLILHKLILCKLISINLFHVDVTNIITKLACCTGASYRLLISQGMTICGYLFVHWPMGLQQAGVQEVSAWCGSQECFSEHCVTHDGCK